MFIRHTNKNETLQLHFILKPSTYSINAVACCARANIKTSINQIRTCMHLHTCMHPQIWTRLIRDVKEKMIKRSQEGLHADLHSVALRQSAASLLLARELSSCGHKRPRRESERNSSQHLLNPPTHHLRRSFI